MLDEELVNRAMEIGCKLQVSSMAEAEAKISKKLKELGFESEEAADQYIKGNWHLLSEETKQQLKNNGITKEY